MANATLTTIEAALYAALTPLVSGPPVAATPFAVAARYAGPTTKKGLSNVCRMQFPAVLLRWDNEPSDRDIDTWGAYSEERGTSSWSVIVVAEDPRAIDDGVVGDANVPGALRLLDLAEAAVNGLAIANTYQARTARVSDKQWELVEEGVVYAAALKVNVLRVLPQATNTDPAAGLPDVQPMIGSVDLISDITDTDAVNPLVTFQADPNP